MIRALLAATALTTSMSMAALAQEADTSTEMNSGADAQVEAPMDSDAGAAMESDAGSEMESDAGAEMNMDADGMEADDMVADDMAADDATSSVSLSAGYMQSDQDFLGSRIMGATVWNSAAEDSEKIGDINDIIFNSNGRMIAAIIGIGGFLEIGEKSVAVGFEELEWTTDINGDPRLVLTGATYDSLEAAPEFVWEMPEPIMDPAMDTQTPVAGDAPMTTEGDAETDAMMDAQGDTTMDPEADVTTESEMQVETPDAGGETSVETDASAKG